MNTKSFRFVHVVGLALLLAFVPLARAGTYFQDFTGAAVGTTNLGDGSTLFSSHPGSAAQVVDATYKELRLTANGTTSTRTALRLPALDATAPSYAFSAKWNATITANFPDAGDGWSFNYGALSATDLINSSFFLPDGYGNGLSFGIRTYFGNSPAFYLRLNGGVVASQPFNPQTQWGLNSSTRHFFEVDWNYTNGVTVRVDGQMIFSNVAVIGFIPAANDRFVFAARTSVFTEEVRLDNITVVTGGTLSQVTTSAPYFADANVEPANPASMAFDGNNSTFWGTHATSGQVGATVPSSSVLVYAVTSPDIANTTQFGRTWTLEGSNNGTNWAACGTGSTPFINSKETRSWLATNQNPFSAYRLNVSQNNGNIFITALGEVRLYRLNPVSSLGWVGLPTFNNVRWGTVATSADGTRIVAAGNPGGVYVSTNSGLSWVQTSVGVSLWKAAVCSTNGNVMAVAAPYDPAQPFYPVYGVHISTNGGVTWTKANVTDNYSWRALAMNDSGSFINAGVDGGGVWQNSPNNLPWQYAVNVPVIAPWTSLSSDDVGNEYRFATADGRIYYYNYTFGSVFLETTLPASTWTGVASSASGARAVAATAGGNIYRDDVGGWRLLIGLNTGLNSITASADLSKVAVCDANNVYLSTDGGTNWAALNPPNVGWTSVALSRDGTRLYASGATYPSFDNRQVWSYGVLPRTRPTAGTWGSSAVRGRGAQLSGGATPNLVPTMAYFEWGTTTNYGNTTAPQYAGDALHNLPIGAALTALQPQTTYHFRTVAWNALGTNYGEDLSFTTFALNPMNLVQMDDPVVASSLNSPPGQGAAQACDGSADTKYLNLDKVNTYLTLYPSVTNVPVVALDLISAEDAPERDPASFALYGSTNGVNFTLIASNAFPPFLGRLSIQTIPFGNTNVYSVYRLHFPTVVNEAAAVAMQIAEIALRPYRELNRTNDIISVTSNGTVASAPSTLIDHRVSADYVLRVYDGTDGANVQEILAAGPTVLKGFEVISGGFFEGLPEFGPQLSPVSVTISGSTNGLDYTLLASNALPVPVGGRQIAGVPLANTNAYTHYRFHFPKPPGGYGVILAELRLFGLEPATVLPRLSLGRLGTNVVLTWPDAPGFQLEKAAQLTSPTWTAVTNAPAQTNLINTVTLPANGPMQFYRLRK
jgi:hypothetical protein